MSDRAIALYDEIDNHERTIVVAFGRFSVAEFNTIRDYYNQLQRPQYLRPYMTSETSGPRIDHTVAQIKEDFDPTSPTHGWTIIATPVFREMMTPTKESEKGYELVRAVEEKYLRPLLDKPLYLDALKGRLTPRVLQTHGDYPLGIVTAWGTEVGITILQTLQATGILTADEIRRAHNNGRPRFMSNVSLEKMLIQS